MQPVFSPSVLAEMIRPDGSSTISILSGESMSAELAHELMGIQVMSKSISCLSISCFIEFIPKVSEQSY